MWVTPPDLSLSYVKTPLDSVSRSILDRGSEWRIARRNAQMKPYDNNMPMSSLILLFNQYYVYSTLWKYMVVHLYYSILVD